MNQKRAAAFFIMVVLGGYMICALDFPAQAEKKSAGQIEKEELSPKIIRIPPTKMAVVRTTGDPNVVGQKAMQALYGSLFQLGRELAKKGVKLQMDAPRARWPNVAEAPREEWIGIWGLPVPEEAESIPQVNSEVEVKLEIWEYGFVAQILHIGPFETEPGTIQALMEFIDENGYAVAGAHEEICLTVPGADPQKTLIRYPVKKRLSFIKCGKRLVMASLPEDF